MHDLNRMITARKTGWELLDYWLESLDYWQGNPKFSASYGNAHEQIVIARESIDEILFGC